MKLMLVILFPLMVHAAEPTKVPLYSIKAVTAKELCSYDAKTDEAKCQKDATPEAVTKQLMKELLALNGSYLQCMEAKSKSWYSKLIGQ